MSPRPPLWRRTWLWLRQLPLTREGGLWSLMAFGMLVTGLFKGINLITLLSCLLLTMVGWNFYLARRQLQSIFAKRLESEPIFANTPWVWQAEITNIQKQSVKELRIQTVDPSDGVRPQFIAELKGHASLTLRTTTTFLRRGVVRESPLQIITGFPLGLVRLSQQIGVAREEIVLPQLGTIQRGALKAFLSWHAMLERRSTAETYKHLNAHVLFHGLRNYRPGDSIKMIHWRTTARRGELMVREFEDPPSEDFCLIVDASRQGTGEDAHLEHRISVAATICWEWNRKRGDQFFLGIVGEKGRIVDGLTGTNLALSMLEALAVEPGSATPDLAPVIEALRESRPQVSTYLVLCANGSTLPARLKQATGYAVVAIEDESAAERTFFQI